MNNIIDNNHIKNFILESGILSESKIKKAEETVFEKNIDFIDALVENNFLDQQTLSEISANILGVPKINLSGKVITLNIFKNIPEIISKTHNLVCFDKTETEICVAFSDIKDLEVLEKYIPENLELKLFLADISEIIEKNKKYIELNQDENSFKNKRSIDKILKTDNFGIRKESDLPPHFRSDIANDVYTEKFVSGILEQAVRAKAEFIFFNISEDMDVEISFRMNDRNYPILNIENSVMFSILSNIKLQSDINIFEDFIIKQSSFKKNILDKDCIIFTTFTKTDFGEAITLQISENKKFKTDVLMLEEGQREMLLSAQKKDSGFFVISGKKESGKSTTLYNFLEFDVEKNKDIYSLEHTVSHNLSYTKQISLDEKTKILPIIIKIIKNHSDVLAVEKISTGTFPTLFNYVSTSKKVFLSSKKEVGKFIDLLVEMDFDKGQIVKNFSLFIEHVKFKILKNPKEYFLNKNDIKVLKSFISESEISELFLGEGLEKESKKKLSKIVFFTSGKKQKRNGEKTNTPTGFFAFKNKNKNLQKNIYLRGILDLGLFLENSFIKRYNKEKIKNTLRKEIKKSVLKNAILASHRQQLDIIEVLKYLTK